MQLIIIILFLIIVYFIFRQTTYEGYFPYGGYPLGYYPHYSGYDDDKRTPCKCNIP